MPPDINFEADYDWNMEAGQQHQWNIQLDLGTQNLFQTSSFDKQSVAENLTTNENHIRQRIFKDVSQWIVPQVVQDISGATTVPAVPNIQTQARIENDSTTDWEIEDGVLNANNQINLAMDFQTNRATDPIQALVYAKGNVAASITDGIVHNLKDAFDGKKKSKMETRFSFDNVR